ncbi:unnamed protein product [Owenia fusiformis]|uniref:Glycosyltransferase 2-like domain-containing protein n=1 Tax=Owenia fusiformis TaxID=6347 RepID=A0A8S4PUP8_OWEFU|nr:unnamed protein product [Owenia fusiformis]
MINMKLYTRILILNLSVAILIYIYNYNINGISTRRKNSKEQENGPDSVDFPHQEKQHFPIEEKLIWTKTMTCSVESGYKNCVDCSNGTSGYDKIDPNPGVNCSYSICQKINKGRQPVMYRQPKYIIPSIESLVTIVVKTANRLNLVERLIRSVWKFYPNVKCIVVDDYNEFFEKRPGLKNFFKNSSNVIYHQAHENAGISYGRNLALKFVRTKYVFLCDDDAVFNSETNIPKLLDLLEHTDLSFAGVTHKNKPNLFFGAVMVRPTEAQNTSTMRSNETVDLLQYSAMYYERLACFGQCYVTDIILNAFLAPLEDLLKMGGWDANLKTQEHIDFFLRVRKYGLKVAVCLDVNLNHRSPRNNPLRQKRLQNKDIYFNIIKHKWNFSKWFFCKTKRFSSYQNRKFPDDWTCKQTHMFDTKL